MKSCSGRGEAGATVYVTARTVDAGAHPLPGTIGKTLAEIEARGGKGIGVALDLHDDAAIEALFAQVAATPGYRIAIDLEARTIRLPDGAQLGFEVDAFRRHCLLNGLDDIGLTLARAARIRDYEARRGALEPWLFD